MAGMKDPSGGRFYPKKSQATEVSDDFSTEIVYGLRDVGKEPRLADVRHNSFEDAMRNFKRSQNFPALKMQLTTFPKDRNK